MPCLGTISDPILLIVTGIPLLQFLVLQAADHVGTIPSDL